MCRSQYLEIVRPFTYYCIFPCRSCRCFVCRRQPPSLAASAANIFFQFTFNLELFELSADTTYDLYLYALRSDRVSRRRLLPTEYPFIRIAYGSDRPDRRRHRHCPGGDGSWQGACANTFSSPVKAITTLTDFQEQLWCEFCLKPLFFPPGCSLHRQPVLPWMP